MQLPEIQERFKKTLLQPLAKLQNVEKDFADLFTEGHIPIQERLKVYHSNVIGGISKVFSANFPLLEKLVGEEFLGALCREFIILNPPKEGCLHDYGSGFNQFIASHSQAREFPYLANMAALEFAITSAGHAKDDEALSAAELSTFPEEKLEDSLLPLRESAKLLKAEYPVLSIRDFCLTPEQNPPDLSHKKENHILVLRPEWEVHLIPLTKGEYVFLENLQKQQTLGASLEKALLIQVNVDIGATFQKHLSLGTFRALKNHLD